MRDGEDGSGNSLVVMPEHVHVLVSEPERSLAGGQHLARRRNLSHEPFGLFPLGVPHFSRLSRSANHGGLRHASILKLPTVGRRSSGKLPEVRHPNCFSLPTRHNQSLPQKLATRPRNSRSLGSGIRGQKARNLQLRAGQAFGHASGYRVNLRERALKSPFHSTLVPVSKFGVFAPSHRPKRYKTSRSRS